MANITTVHLAYGYLLANTPLTLQGVGKVVSPKLKVLYGESQDNWQNYIFMQAVTKGNFSSFVKIAEAFLGTPLPQDITANSKYDILIHIQKLREVFIQALSLFFLNRIEYFDEYGFIFFNEKTDDVEGCLNAETFELYCSIIAQLMHDGKVENQPQKEHEDFSDKPPEVIHALKMFEKYLRKLAPRDLLESRNLFLRSSTSFESAFMRRNSSSFSFSVAASTATLTSSTY